MSDKTGGRPIKFRAWHNRQLWSVTSIAWSNGKLFELGLADESKRRAYGERDGLELAILMQFTGLTDKNGKEIWEGDICASPARNLGKIIWDVPHCHFALNVGDKAWSLGGNFLVWNTGGGKPAEPHLLIEVLGNLYENPDLLQ